MDKSTGATVYGTKLGNSDEILPALVLARTVVGMDYVDTNLRFTTSNSFIIVELDDVVETAVMEDMIILLPFGYSVPKKHPLVTVVDDGLISGPIFFFISNSPPIGQNKEIAHYRMIIDATVISFCSSKIKS
jgi:hypothetical protein